MGREVRLSSVYQNASCVMCAYVRAAWGCAARARLRTAASFRPQDGSVLCTAGKLQESRDQAFFRFLQR